jgi:hypothetical protein
MPIFYVPDNNPSRNYAGNSPTAGYANPAHGIIGGLAKSGTDPRNRGRKRTREEIEASSRANYNAKRERLAKLREEVEAKKAADKEARESKRIRVEADRSAAAAAANPETARRERLRKQTADEAAARRGQPLKRLTPEEMEANRKAIGEREAAARRAEIAGSRAPAGTMDKLMSERMKPEGPSLSDTLAASEAAGAPHVARAAANMMSRYGLPEPAMTAPRDTRLETPQPELAAALTAALATKKSERVSQAKPAQSESNRLISNAFSVPGAANLSSVYSPEQQQRGLFAQRRMLGQGNPAVPSLPNRIADQLGETVSGLATKGLSYFNADEGEFAEANEARRKMMEERKRQRELDALYGPNTGMLGEMGDAFGAAGTELFNLPRSVNESLRNARGY